MLGTLLNTAAIITGSLIGMVIHSRLPQKMIDIVFQAIGLFTIALGISMSLSSDNMIIVIISLVTGAVIGQWIDIDRHFRRLSDYLHSLGKKDKPGNTSGDTRKNTENNSRSRRFTEGLVTASMLFCVGSMSILGAIEEGTGQTPNLYFTKSIMDGISSVALAASFGVAILFSSVPVLIYQGALTIFAANVARFMSETVIADLSGVGGIMLIGLGISILKIKNINVINMLPALVIVVLLSYFRP